MNFFNIDQHISIIADMKYIFTRLGHTVGDWSISNHTWVFNRPKDIVPLLEGDNWKNVIKDHLWDQFYDTYKEDLKDVDAFISCYSPMFAMLYQRFNKPVIINTPIRYEHPFSFIPEEWECFNEFIRKGIDSNKVLLVANNIYDKYYCEGFVNRETYHIPSLCEYTGSTYQPNTGPYVYYARSTFPEVSEAVPISKVLPGRYYTKDLLQFKGIVHFPYQISTMSIFEQYTMNIPLFVPTPEFLMDLYRFGAPVLKEVSWNCLFNGPATSAVSFTGKYDPNNYRDYEGMKYWLKYADFYDQEWMPYITYFESIDHLNRLLREVDPIEISNKMKEKNKERKEKVYALWDTLLKTWKGFQ